MCLPPLPPFICIWGGLAEIFLSSPFYFFAHATSCLGSPEEEERDGRALPGDGLECIHACLLLGVGSCLLDEQGTDGNSPLFEAGLELDTLSVEANWRIRRKKAFFPHES